MQILRWIAVLPGAVLSAVLIMFPVHWMIMLLQSPSEDAVITRNGKGLLASIPTELLEQAAQAFVTPFMLVFVSALIAPKYKFPTGITFAILWALGFGAASVFVLTHGEPKGGMLAFAISCALGVVGVGFGLVKAYKEQLEQEQKLEAGQDTQR